MRPSDPQSRPLSELVRDVSNSEATTLSLGELVDLFGGRALAGLLLVLGLICTLPLPPGATTVFGLPLLLLAPQLLLDANAPWLPAQVRDRRIRTAELKPGLARVTPWLEKMEAFSRPRLRFVVGGAGRRLIGLICTLFAVVLILPIPLGNMLPAATVSLFSLALVQRDGVLALAGYLFTAASLGVLVLAADLIGAMIRTGISALALA